MCITEGCQKKPRKGHRMCCTCASKKYRAANPMAASYQNLKQNAKRRHKIFTITFEYFKQFAYETNFIPGNGRRKDSHSVDCIIAELGYVPGNLERLSLQENGRKKDKILVYDWRTRSALVIDGYRPENKDDNIF